MTLRHLGKVESTVLTHILRFACSILAASAVFASPALAAEMSPPSDASPKPSDGVKASVPRGLSDAQIEALMKEIGLPYGGSAEVAATPEAKMPPPQTTAAPPDAQMQGVLREMRQWYDSRTAAVPRPDAKLPPPSQRTWPHHWRHYAGRAEADRGEATRLMREELQQRGVAVEPAAGSGEPK
jgi:hypothetical protein